MAVMPGANGHSGLRMWCFRAMWTRIWCYSDSRLHRSQWISLVMLQSRANASICDVAEQVMIQCQSQLGACSDSSTGWLISAQLVECALSLVGWWGWWTDIGVWVRDSWLCKTCAEAKFGLLKSVLYYDKYRLRNIEPAGSMGQVNLPRLYCTHHL
jgi:hypothetical protein